MENLQKQTLADQIYGIIREDILTQRLKCGEKITLKQLQERFQISSTPVREALKRLGQDGLIEHETNIGAKVVDISFADALEIYELCLILDSAALKNALTRNKAPFLSALQQNVLHQKEALEQGDLVRFKSFSDDFHDIFHRYSENSRLLQASVRIRSQLTILSNIYQSSVQNTSTVYEEHLAIFQAISGGDLSHALELLELHFKHAAQFITGEK